MIQEIQIKKMETFRNQLNTVKNALEKIACFAHESNRNVKNHYEIHWFWRSVGSGYGCENVKGNVDCVGIIKIEIWLLVYENAPLKITKNKK